jgi:hypothetical protein
LNLRQIITAGFAIFAFLLFAAFKAFAGGGHGGGAGSWQSGANTYRQQPGFVLGASQPLFSGNNFPYTGRGYFPQSSFSGFSGGGFSGGSNGFTNNGGNGGGNGGDDNDDPVVPPHTDNGGGKLYFEVIDSKNVTAPEPVSSVLFLSGLAVMGLRRRLNKKS